MLSGSITFIPSDFTWPFPFSNLQEKPFTATQFCPPHSLSVVGAIAFPAADDVLICLETLCLISLSGTVGPEREQHFPAHTREQTVRILWYFQISQQQSVKTEGVKQRGVIFFMQLCDSSSLAFRHSAPYQWKQDQSACRERSRFVAPFFKVIICKFFSINKCQFCYTPLHLLIPFNSDSI